MRDSTGSLSSPLHASIARPRAGADTAVLFVHGFTGSPAVFADLAAQISAEEPVSVFAPRLAGHGTSWQDMAATRWQDWFADAEAGLLQAAAEHERVIVVGLSMGGALCLALAAEHPELVSQLVLINPALYVDSPLAPLTPLLKHVVPSIAGVGGDIAKPGETEHAYPRTPVAAVASLHTGLKALRARLWQVAAPTTLLISATDHVVGPRSARLLRSTLLAPLHTTVLRRSYHVATVDFDQDVIAAHIRTAIAEAASAGQNGIR